MAGAFLAGAFFAEAFVAGAFLAGAFFAEAFVADAFVADAFVAAAFFDAEEVRETTLRAAAPARLAKDLRLAVAMGGGAPIGLAGVREVIRGGARIDGVSIPFNSPCAQHSPTLLAHWSHRTAWRGRVPDCTATSELGTV